MIQPLHAGNALRLFFEPPSDAIVWRVLRKASSTFSGPTDPSALLVYEGVDHVIVEAAESLTNDQAWFYAPYSSVDGVTWVAGVVKSGTPAAIYVDHTTDVMSHMRERLAAGLLVECQRGNFHPEMGYIQVYTAPPALEQSLRFPLVVLELEAEESTERGIGEDISTDDFDELGGEWAEYEGWLASVRLNIVALSLNSDERIELRKALRRIVAANMPVFESYGWVTPSISQGDSNMINGEYPAQIYQANMTFSCIAPVRVAGAVPAVQSITVGNING